MFTVFLEYFRGITVFLFSPGGDLIPSVKYKMSEAPINEFSLKMDLIITNLELEDFGGYLCIAKNALGKAEGSIRLQGSIFKSQKRYSRSFAVFTYSTCVIPYERTKRNGRSSR